MPKSMYDNTNRKRKVMRKLKIDELSLCGRPAQAPALATIMKRRDDDPGPQGGDMGDTTKQAAPAGGEDVNKAKTVVIYESQHRSTETRETMDDGAGGEGSVSGTVDLQITAKGKEGEGADANKGDGTAAQPGATQTVEEKLAALEARQTALETENTALKAKLTKAEAEAALTPTERAHYDSLDDAAKAIFLQKGQSDRQGDIAKAADDNAVLYEFDDGTVVRKSDGAQMIALAKARDEDGKRIAKLEKERSDDAFAKRADAELSHLPGTTAQRSAILKALEGIDDPEIRKATLEAVRANDGNLAKAFERAGTAETPADEEVGMTAEDEIHTLATNLAKAENISWSEAYEKVLQSPDGQRLYHKSVRGDVMAVAG